MKYLFSYGMKCGIFHGGSYDDHEGYMNNDGRILIKNHYNNMIITKHKLISFRLF